MVIACIAMHNLTPSVKSEVDRLLKVNPSFGADNFIAAGPWADDVRNERRETGPWHYVNLHFRDDGRPSRNHPDPENVLVAIGRMTKTLGDRTQSDASRAEALRFLIHFVGDLHQPLHATARDTAEFPHGDRGGNDFKILPPGNALGPTNLHALWDSGARLFVEVDRPPSADALKQVEQQAQEFMAASPKDKTAGAGELAIDTWATEGLTLARERVYRLRPNEVPGSEYLASVKRISQERATLAGYRLAAYLNKLLGEKS